MCQTPPHCSSAPRASTSSTPLLLRPHSPPKANCGLLRWPASTVSGSSCAASSRVKRRVEVHPRATSTCSTASSLVRGHVAGCSPPFGAMAGGGSTPIVAGSSGCSGRWHSRRLGSSAGPTSTDSRPAADVADCSSTAPGIAPGAGATCRGVATGRSSVASGRTTPPGDPRVFRRCPHVLQEGTDPDP
jgi:hypothetical protein